MAIATHDHEVSGDIRGMGKDLVRNIDALLLFSKKIFVYIFRVQSFCNSNAHVCRMIRAMSCFPSMSTILNGWRSAKSSSEKTKSSYAYFHCKWIARAARLS
jgi:hypothetical protein